MREPIPAIDRIYARIKVHPLGCWEWPGSTTRGYGTISRPGASPAYVHRVVWEAEVGPIPDGMHIDHLCLNSLCCNPAHLEPVSPEENARRLWAVGRGNAGAANRVKTHCPRGHEYTDENTARDYRGKRTCRACQRNRWGQGKDRRAA